MTVSTFGVGIDTGAAPQISVPPGDPDQLAAASRVYAAAGESMSRLAHSVRGTGQSVVGAQWFGIASLAYLSTSDHAADWLTNAYQALSLGASALATYALELRQAQDTARAAQSAAAELDTAARHLQAQVASDPTQALLPSPQSRQAADLIAQGRQRAGALGAQAEQMAQAAAAKAAAAFAHTAAMTQAGRIAAAKAAAAQQAAHESHHSFWQVAGVVGLGLVDAGLTVANVAQLGLDPLTDAAEAGTVSATAGLAADLAEGGAAEAAAADVVVAGGAEAEAALAETATEEVATQAASKPDWLIRVGKGAEFNAEQGARYEEAGGVNELYVEKTPAQLAKNGYPYHRVDTYLEDEEIISRKFTQLSEVQESTGRHYVQELFDKYPPGRTIADVPSTPPALRGSSLTGDMVLEVPVQNAPVPQSVLDLAKELDITIRDINGTIYGP